MIYALCPALFQLTFDLLFFVFDFKCINFNPLDFFRCKMNCLDKLNPAERLILESVCTDCNAATKLSYKWSLLSLEPLGKETDVSGFSSMTTTGVNRANVVVIGNALKPGKDYSLKISAWKPGGEKGMLDCSSTALSFRYKVSKILFD